MPDSSAKKKAIQLVLRVDRQYTIMLAVCWAVTTLLSCVLGGLFMGLGILAFLTRGGADVMAALGAMACACTVVPYVVSRSAEGFGRARVLEQLVEELDERRRTRETVP